MHQIKKVSAATEADFVAFFSKGNKAAGTRIRNAMQQLKTLTQKVIELKNKAE
ncbi:histone H1 [Mucilaginibacter robiniae]|uniref:Histone H1 n=1 Tax=Mucilaginibacter robiniae TaxID=2728022 RepID=A0A7L5E639_9SPHI|nr:histone H1 [Mucilaginibacter robiniae]QJD98451.1 histone H1 [Mucilaginibacter robiniae]